jgi:phosphoribosylformylglycinamidine synthase
VSAPATAGVPAWAKDPDVTPALARSFGLGDLEYGEVCSQLGRTPRYAELGVFSVMYSEHCSYKSSRVHLKRLPTTGPRVTVGPGENAGAIDIGDGFCAVFKMESHNHPSFLAPYQGAATGVGGILRDVFTMGARPIASLNSLRFGRPDHPRTPELMRGVVKGIGDYGNCIGVPTVGGEVQFDASYDGNILVNAFTLGIARIDGLFFGRAEGVGNPVLYVGAKTGRDGIHGATMASAEFDAESAEDLPTVQVGDPFMEKLLLEACLEIFAKKCLVGVQDMGAAGLTSSSVEMAARAGSGIELDLDLIPRRTRRLTPYELLLSESQERMLMVAERGREHEVFEVCKKWDLDAAVVGRVTDTGRYVCLATPGYDPLDPEAIARDPRPVVDIPVGLLVDGAPKYERPERAVVRPDSERNVAPPPITDASAELLALVGSPNIGSRAWVWRQYDHVVGDGTVFRPGQADAAVVRAFCTDATGTHEKFLATAVDCNGRHVELDPHQGAAMAVAECARNVACVGAEPVGLTDCLNFGNPEKPEVMWRFARAVDGIGDACRALGIAVVSGNVSLYNETEGRSILPTPTVAVVGQLRAAEDRVGMAFAPDCTVVRLGAAPRGALGGSEWLTQKLGRVAGESPGIDLGLEARLQKVLVALAQARVLASAHDVSDGGIAVCLAESCVAGGTGATLALDLGRSPGGLHALFSEEPSCVVVSYRPEHTAAVARLCTERDVPHATIGTTGGDVLVIDDVLRVPVADLARAHAAALDAIVGS